MIATSTSPSGGGFRVRAAVWAVGLLMGWLLRHQAPILAQHLSKFSRADVVRGVTTSPSGPQELAMLNKCRRAILWLLLSVQRLFVGVHHATSAEGPATRRPISCLSAAPPPIVRRVRHLRLLARRRHPAYGTAALTALGAYSAGYGFVGISRCRQWKAETQGVITWRRANQLV